MKVEKEQGEEGIEDRRGFKEKFIIHDARAEKEAACHHPQLSLIHICPRLIHRKSWLGDAGN